MRYTTHIVHITETQSNVPSEDLEDITLVTVPLNLGRFASADRALLEAWNVFYGRALDNGQESQEFKFSFVDEMTAEVVLFPNYVPSGDAALAGEFFTLRLEV